MKRACFLLVAMLAAAIGLSEVYAKMEAQTEEDFENLADYVYEKYSV